MRLQIGSRDLQSPTRSRDGDLVTFATKNGATATHRRRLSPPLRTARPSEMLRESVTKASTLALVIAWLSAACAT